MKIYFLSSLVPDTPEFRNSAFTRSGNNVLEGIAMSFYKMGIDISCFSCVPIPSFPRSKRIYIPGNRLLYKESFSVKTYPTINIKILKNLFWGIYSFFSIIIWKLKNWRSNCHLIVYNVYCPPIPFVYYACRLTRIKIHVIFYDLGVPPKNLKLSWTTQMAYRFSEKFVSYFMRKVDGRIVINERIIGHYAPGCDSLLIDGGINETVISLLFPLEIVKNQEITFLCAGKLWEQNGTKLILDTMKINKNENIKIIFAGQGNDVPLIEEAARTDKRILYAGMLTMKDLFCLYEKADVLLNLRIEQKEDFHFPSKFFEYMVTGKKIISTNVAHAKRDYGKYVIFLDEISPERLSQSINDLLKKSKQTLIEEGKLQRAYMLNERTWFKRTQEIYNYIKNK